MVKSYTWAERQSIGSSLVDLGYRDYIAARFLLNNEFIVQGLTLASTAVEKYLKALIVFTSKKKERYNYHFDNLMKLKTILAKNDQDVTEKFDPVFLAILEKAYKIRYYDKLKKPVEIGFFLNQFIGELDSVVHFLETTDTPGLLYKQAIKNKDPNLFQNNFILNNQGKIEFMERPDTAIAIHIEIGSSYQRESKIVGRNIVNKYEGHLAIFANPFEPDWLVNTLTS
ncbi:HEPN domain-containing protein [Pseudocnuella soli]|uniref:HEPN domain-containing protein n=1 Tax=Pseudocnuella soli TaxID=2502779 RepID=UPI001045FEDB|nr:HEPN domain-containing protein [Pseudocnuella soli]